MKVAIQILSTLQEPSTRNIETIKNTYIALANSLSEQGKLKHTYDFYFYYGGYAKEGQEENTAIVEKDETINHCYNVFVNMAESIYNTFEKGIETLKATDGYDWYIRCNISCYINIPVLDKCILLFNSDEVYCNSINSYVNDEKRYNDLYPRGDFMIFSKAVRKGILQNADKYIRCDFSMTDRINVPHVDDCMFGLCIIDYFGRSYYKHLKALKYNYIPSHKEEISTVWNKNYISTRVKTIPPGITFSGYSWEDNDYRKMDCYKMNYLNDAIKNEDYSGLNLKLNDLISTSKPIIFITPSFKSINTFHEFLKNERGS